MISLNTITSYKGTGSVLLDANGTGLESVGFKQQLKSFFNVGDAQDKNRELLRAIRTAIRVDNRFSSTDIQDHADRLFAEVRTDRAIDVSRLKGIVQELENLALVSGSNIGKRVDLHVAAGAYTAVGLSDFTPTRWRSSPSSGRTRWPTTPRPPPSSPMPPPTSDTFRWTSRGASWTRP